jgi:hypothetical protein
VIIMTDGSTRTKRPTFHAPLQQQYVYRHARGIIAEGGDLVYDGRLTARKRFILRPDNANITPPVAFPRRHLRLLLPHHRPLTNDCWKKTRTRRHKNPHRSQHHHGRNL